MSAQKTLVPLALLALLATGCSSGGQETVSQPSATAPQTVATASPTVNATAQPEPVPTRVELPETPKPIVAEVSREPDGEYITQTAFAAVTEEPSPEPKKPEEPKVKPPADAYQGAGKDAPKEAIDLAKNAAGVYAITTPSGNISCQFGTEFEGCGVISFRMEGRYRDGETNNWFVRFNGDGEPTIVDYKETPGFTAAGTVPLEYGKSAKAGDHVCASEDMGITCWNTKTKRGFFVNRDGFTTFNESN